MKNFLIKIKLYVFAHKIISLVVVVVLIGAGYFGYQKITTKAGVNLYITSKATTGTIISSITEMILSFPFYLLIISK